MSSEDDGEGADDEIGAEEVFSIFYDPSEPEDGCVGTMRLREFIDDSKDGQQKKYVIAAGLLGPEDVWGEFKKEWKRVLSTPPRIEYFHSKEWRSLTGEFLQFRDNLKWPNQLAGKQRMKSDSHCAR